MLSGAPTVLIAEVDLGGNPSLIDRAKKPKSPLCTKRNTLKPMGTLGQLSVMVVERNALTRKNLAQHFRVDGHHVYEAKDAASATDHLKAHNEIEIVLLDVDIPSWRSVLTYGRENLPRATILCMGNLDSTVVIRKVFQLGVDDYLIKPIAYDQIREIVSRAVP